MTNKETALFMLKYWYCKINHVMLKWTNNLLILCCIIRSLSIYSADTNVNICFVLFEVEEKRVSKMVLSRCGRVFEFFSIYVLDWHVLSALLIPLLFGLLFPLYWFVICPLIWWVCFWYNLESFKDKIGS